MGMFFSSLHFHRTAALTHERVVEAVSAAWERQGYRRTSSPEGADVTLELLEAEGSAWFSLQSEDLDFSGLESIRELAAPLSRDLDTAVLAVSCDDSDYLFLNWIDEAAGLDAWANVGRCPGRVPRRSGFSAWRKIVPDLDTFRRVIKTDYVFAEESLLALAPILDLPETQSLPGIEEHPDAMRLYFACPDAPTSQGHPRLTFLVCDGEPCRAGKIEFLDVLNRGDASRGLAVAFTGPWVEHDEIRITDLRLESDFSKHPHSTQPLTLEKIQDQNGNWVLLAKAPHFPLPASRRMLSPMKQLSEDHARSFGVRFTPEGDSRKYLDIHVVFIPLEDPVGQCGWCVWAHSGSREAYIRQHNESWSRIPGQQDMLLDPNDYDL